RSPLFPFSRTHSFLSLNTRSLRRRATTCSATSNGVSWILRKLSTSFFFIIATFATNHSAITTAYSCTKGTHHFVVKSAGKNISKWMKPPKKDGNFHPQRIYSESAAKESDTKKVLRTGTTVVVA
ncbi:DHHC-type zinc finger family protein, partial [Striga asiatica]